MTDQELIAKLQQLKEIKPNQNWVSSVKSQVLWGENKKASTAGKLASILDFLPSISFQRKLAYSFAALIIIFVGVLGFARLSFSPTTQPAALSGDAGLKQNVAILNNKINTLAEATKSNKKINIPSALSEVRKSALQLAKNLKANPTADSPTLKEIATSLRTLADVPGVDLSQDSDIKNSYQIIVQSLIDDFSKTTLTDGQKTILADVQNLYNQGKYDEAMTEILTKLQPSPSPSESPEPTIK